jgi:hypothetical protein
MIYPENVQLWKLFLAKGDTSDTFEVWHFWGRKRSYTLLNVYLKASHLVELSELQLTNSSCPINNRYHIGHEDSVGLSVCKERISACRWRIYT